MEFDWWAHQMVAPILNPDLRIYYVLWFFFSTGVLRKKTWSGPIRNWFVFQLLILRKVCGKNSWNKLVKTSDEFVGIRKIQDRWLNNLGRPPFPLLRSQIRNSCTLYELYVRTLSNHYHCKPGVTAFHKSTYGWKLVLCY